MTGERETLSALLERVAEEAGEAPALLYDGGSWSHAELLDRSRRAASALAALGIGRGDKVALWLPNVPAWLALYFALGRLGAVAVAVNTRFRALEVADILARSGAKALAMWPGFKDIDFAGLLAEIGEDALVGLERVLVYDEGESPVPERIAGKPVTAVSALFEAPPLAEDRAAPEDACNIFTTSGTTSKPKFVLHGQYPVTRHARDCVSAFGWDRPGAVSYQATPLCGVFGFSTMMATLAAGAPNILTPLFTPGEAANALRRHRVTHFMGTDDMYAGMLALREEPEPFPSLRLCGYALFNPTLEDFAARTLARGVPLIGLYGMSEVGALMAVQRIDAPLEDRLAGGGYPVTPEAVVRVRNVETGELCPPGVSGEVEMRCPSLFLCYEGNPEATAAAMTEDGFLRTGDAGRMRADGSFVYEARMGDTLRLAGFLTAPSEIEAHIETHPSVAGCQVVGTATPRGPRAFAFVRPADGCYDEAALLAWCRETMANYKVPVRATAIDAFPVTHSANGTKIQKAELRRMAEALEADAVSARCIRE